MLRLKAKKRTRDEIIETYEEIMKELDGNYRTVVSLAGQFNLCTKTIKRYLFLIRLHHNLQQRNIKYGKGRTVIYWIGDPEAYD